MRMVSSVADFICLEGLSKTYLEGTTPRNVLHEASATFAKGEFAAILGKSGN